MCVGLLQNILHFFDGYQIRIIINCIDFFKPAEAFFDFMNSLQPIQGRFAYIISLDRKRHPGIQPLLIGENQTS